MSTKVILIGGSHNGETGFWNFADDLPEWLFGTVPGEDRPVDADDDWLPPAEVYAKESFDDSDRLRYVYTRTRGHGGAA